MKGRVFGNNSVLLKKRSFSFPLHSIALLAVIEFCLIQTYLFIRVEKKLLVLKVPMPQI